MNTLSLSADIGGTFTDLVLTGPFGRVTRKVLTNVGHPEIGLLDGARQLLAEQDVSFADVGTFVHGTTLATNALLERKGARVALITTRGFRDVLEIGTEGRFDQYDIQLSKPVPLVSRELRIGVGERIAASGEVLLPLDRADAEQAIETLRNAGIDSVAIGFLHAYANSAHEFEIAEMIAAALPGISLSLSSDVCPEIREFERISTTVANAFVKPMVDGYLGRMVHALESDRFTGKLFLVTSGGGLTSVETARRYPIRLVESGPAGGAIYASRRAREMGLERAIAFDMGGTTAKVCLIRKGEPTSASSFEVDRTHRFMKGSGIPLRIPSIELVEIGAGGGSIAGVDALGRVTVGPESAGSEPGPACYPGGGTKPTVTDAGLVLGLLDGGNFAGGRIVLDPDRAGQALENVVGTHLGLTATMAAHAVFETVCENMASAVRVHAAECGEAVSEYAMIAFGGAAPLHAATVAEKVGIERVIVPLGAGVGSAVGFLEAPVSFDLVRSLRMPLAAFDREQAEALLDAMVVEARGLLAVDADTVKVSVRRTAFMRYVGQGHEIPVALPDAGEPLDAAALLSLFEAEYAQLFSRSIPHAAVEILNWSVLATADTESASQAAAAWDADDGGRETRRVFDGNQSGWIDVPVVTRGSLSRHGLLQGPAVVVEAETSTFVPQSFQASVDERGFIIMQRKAV